MPIVILEVIKFQSKYAILRNSDFNVVNILHVIKKQKYAIDCVVRVTITDLSDILT